MAVTKDNQNKKNTFKIQTAKLEKDLSNSDGTDLLDCIQILLRFHNIERSHVSIRSMADVSDGSFDYKDAVSALQNMEFDSNIGTIPLRKLNNGHCPLIVELRNQRKVVVTKVDPKKEYVIYDSNEPTNYKSYRSIRLYQ